MILIFKEDPLQQGYSRVNQNTDGTLSNSTTSTSLDTVVIDTSTDNISNSPKLKQKPGTFHPILESDDGGSSNPFAEDLRALARTSKKSTLKGQTHISFGGEEEEEADKFDEDAFRKKREHFQKTKSRSEHKSILIRVSIMTYQHHQCQQLLIVSTFFRRICELILTVISIEVNSSQRSTRHSTSDHRSSWKSCWKEHHRRKMSLTISESHSKRESIKA